MTPIPHIPALRRGKAYESLDKTEVMAIARRIGTFDISTRQAEGCCFVPSNPVTVGTLSKLKRVIARLDERPSRPPEEPSTPEP